MSSSGAWIRHPSDAELPEANEYDAYNPVTNYSVEAPVAWVDPDNPLRAQAIVMCLSCHRAHASDQPDMLRWPYSDMQVGTTDPSKAGTGCFTCHTEKDGV
ncbi:MAG: hypothetical protein GTO60_11920 [Gammaproteobacteria bacterium]|nr:hypothetical protein [Gammaproteobacteria bacterium]